MLRDTAGEKVRMFLSCCIETLSDCNEIRNVLYSSSAHECAIGEVSVRTEGLKTTSYQSVYTGHIPFSPAMSRSITGHSRGGGWKSFDNIALLLF